MTHSRPVSFLRDPSVQLSFVVRKRSALPTTDTELKLNAAATIGFRRRSSERGYSTPAAIGTPSALQIITQLALFLVAASAAGTSDETVKRR